VAGSASPCVATPLSVPVTADRVAAVVVTYNRAALLLECLEALAAQTHPLCAVVLVDCASTDGTLQRVRESGVGDRLSLRIVALERNGGGAEGFHAGVRAASGLDADWLWLMDDDCEAPPGTLAALLASAPAADPRTAAVLPELRSAEGAPLPLHRGHIRRRWFFAPLVALSAEERTSGRDVEVSMGTFVGPLIRAEAAHAAGLPERRAFIRLEDVEYLTRVRRHGRLWLVPAVAMIHKEPIGDAVTAAGLRARLGDFTARRPFAQEWKRLYSLRNMIQFGRRHGYVSAGQALSYVLVHVARSLLFGERRRRTAWLAAVYGLDGWRGRFRNLPPERWPALADAPRPLEVLRREALSYE
jgi:rhamnopyranosyl-N-acetylglucosaminyl-diphospho-decaprenol beta-1,3/1,4-galactofuranosyltransferase